MNRGREFLDSYSRPHCARLRSNFFAACFPLMKLLPARLMLKEARASGLLPEGGAVVETTSGTFGLALAMIAAVEGYELSLVSATSLIDNRHRRRIELLGARLEVIDDAAGTGAQIERLEHLSTIRRDHPQIYWPDQYSNPHNPMAYAELAEWMIRNIGPVDCLVGCVGSGGSLCGTGSFLREIFPEMEIIAVDTHHSVLFGHKPARRLLRGMGNSVLTPNLRHDLVDQVHWVGGLPAFESTHQLYREHGLFMGPTSGAAVRVGSWYAQNHPDAVTVAICADEGHRYLDTVYDENWLSGLAGWPHQGPDEPEALARIAPRGEGAWTRFAWNRAHYDANVQPETRLH